MNKIIVGTTELEVVKLTPFAYMQGKGEKVLQIKVKAGVISFDDLRNLLECTENTVAYYEEDTLICEYVGYSGFEVTYSDGLYNVELHKASLDSQMSALLNANEKLTKSQAALENSNEALTKINRILVDQNELLTGTITDLIETVIPSMFSDMTQRLEILQLKLPVQKNDGVAE